MDVKQAKVDTGRPQFRYVIPNSLWVIVVTTTGHHFYHNPLENRSVWKMEDEEERMRVYDLVDRDALILLVAKARGLKLDDDTESNPLARDDQGVPEDGDVAEGSGTAPTLDPVTDSHTNESETTTMTPLVRSDQPPIPLVSGYGSDSDLDINALEASPGPVGSNPNPQTGYGSDSNAMSRTGIDSDSESDSDAGLNEGLDLGLDSDTEEGAALVAIPLKQTMAKLKALFSLYKLNPFNPWAYECEKIIAEPLFYEADDKLRQKAFLEWCREESEQVEGEKLQVTLSNPAEPLDTGIKAKEAALDPSFVRLVIAATALLKDPRYLFFQYLEQTIGSSSRRVAKWRFYVDFKRKFRTDEAFKALELADKEREKCFREYIRVFAECIGDPEMVITQWLSKRSLASLDIAPITIQAIAPLLDREMTYKAFEHVCGVVGIELAEPTWFLLPVERRLAVLLELCVANSTS